MSKKITETWTRFLRHNFNVVLRNQPQTGKERKYDHVQIKKVRGQARLAFHLSGCTLCSFCLALTSQNFQEFEEERLKKKVLLVEYKNQVKKKLIQKQLNLKTLVERIEDEVN